MRHFGKRAFALILALMLCLSLFPSALAEDAGSIAAEDAPEQGVAITPAEEGDIIPAEEGSIAPADEGSIRPAEEGDALPRTDETQDGKTSGQCGDDLTWSFDEATGTLTITGSGDMWDWKSSSAVPWADLSASIKSVVVREGVESIMDQAFHSCTKLSSITLPGSLAYLGIFALPSDNLQEVYFGGTLEAWKALQVSYDRTKVTVHCADGDLLPAAEEQCGDALTWSFDEATGTLTIIGSGEMWNYETRYSSGYAILSTAPWGNLYSSIKSVELPSGLTSIGSFAFWRCSDLTNVTIPDSVTSIGSYAFYGCSGLTSVTIPGSVTSIGSFAFYNCRRLTEVTILEGVVIIWGGVFYDCSGLTGISIPASATEINTYLFNGCQNLKDIYYAGTCEVWRGLNLVYDRGSVTVHCADGTIEPKADTNRCGENLSWALEDGVLTITGTGEMWNFWPYSDSSSSTRLSTAPWYAQRDLIKQIHLAEGVTGIGNYAFGTYDGYSDDTICMNLVSVELPKTLERIGICGLAGHAAQKELRLPDSLREIGDYALAGCGFTELALPESLETIGSGAFYNAKIRSLTIPASVTEIGTYAFQYSSLSDIRFLGDAPAIAGTAFYGKTVTAYYPKNNPTWTKSMLRGYGGVITWVGYVPTGGTLSIGNKESACIGRQFTVDLMLDENPGVMMLSFRLEYDNSVMEFIGAEDGVFSGWTVNAAKNALEWDSDRNRTETGTLLRLRFRVKDDAAPGEARIGITDLFAANYDEEQLYFETKSGLVTLIPHLAGDANGDGQVNGNDLIRLRKYLAEEEKDIIEGNADVNADNVVNILDLIRLRKYFVQEDGVILE